MIYTLILKIIQKLNAFLQTESLREWFPPSKKQLAKARVEMTVKNKAMLEEIKKKVWNFFFKKHEKNANRFALQAWCNEERTSKRKSANVVQFIG